MNGNKVLSVIIMRYVFMLKQNPVLLSFFLSFSCFGLRPKFVASFVFVVFELPESFSHAKICLQDIENYLHLFLLL